MGKANLISLKYFRPKKIEYFRNKTIYDLIGIKIFKKYLPTTGDLARRRKKIKQIELTSSDRYKELYRYELKTRNYEWRHIIGAIIFVVIRFLFDSELRFTIWDLTLFTTYEPLY